MTNITKEALAKMQTQLETLVLKEHIPAINGALEALATIAFLEGKQVMLAECEKKVKEIWTS